MRLIDADQLVRDIRTLYCQGCQRRTGIKGGKVCTIYEIGDVPCRACYVDDIVDEIESAADPYRLGSDETTQNNAPNALETIRLIDGSALYEKVAEWEAQALHMVEITMNDEDTTEWRKWSTILTERSAFKYDVADAPTIGARATGYWITLKDEHGDIVEAVCSNCQENGRHDWAFCPRCGAKMEEVEP